jgi:antirestriction protein
MFSTDTSELIETLLEHGHSYDEMIQFIDENGEITFQKYYENYLELTELYSVEIVEAFLSNFEIDLLEHFEEAYCGQYNSEQQFAESYYEELGLTIPHGIVVDWQRTWDTTLYYDFVFEQGFVFRRAFA